LQQVAGPPSIDPSLICNAATTVPDPRKHKFVRVGNELIPIGFDAAGQQLASAGAPFGKPRV
jgi:hypothetical protein